MTVNRKILMVLAAAALTLSGAGVAQKVESADALLRLAADKAAVDGDLPAAIKQYQAIVDEFSKTDRRAVAAALLGMAECYEKLGDDRSRGVYEKIVKEFSSEAAIAARASLRLRALGSLAAEVLRDRIVAGGAGRFTSSDLSSDARYLLFPETQTGGPAIRNLVSGEVTHLLEGPPSDNLTPRWSRDRKLISYLWAGDVGGKPVSEVRIIPGQPGGKPRTLWSSLNSSDLDHLVPFFWSADGKAILVDMPHADRTWQFGWLSVTDGQIQVLKSFDWRRPFAAGQRKPALSPDGKYIAYGALATNPASADGPPPGEGDECVYVLAADGTMESALTRTAGLNRQPIWSADGRYVLFLSSLAGSTDLWGIGIQQGKAQGSPFLIKENIGLVTPTRMTASGEYYYVRDADYRSPQVSFSALRPGATPIPQGEPFFGASPKWSPDGKNVAVSRTTSDGRSSLIVRTLATGEEQGFSVGAGETIESTLWYHESRALFVMVHHPDAAGARSSGRGGGFRSLARADLNTGALEKLTSVPSVSRGGGISPALSPDDHTLYLLGEVSTGVPTRVIVALDLKTGQSRRVFELPNQTLVLYPGSLSVSPDGSALAFGTWASPAAEQVHLARVGSDGSGFRELATVLLGSGLPVWSADSRSIFFAQLDGSRTSRIMRVPASGGPLMATGVQAEGLTGFTVDPTGSRIAFTHTSAPLELHVLEGVGAFLKAPR